MPSYAAEATAKPLPVSPAASFGFSSIDRECVSNLVGHTLARIEREFILQTSRSDGGNRTRTADRLGISIRSLRNRIRDYRCRGESVPETGNVASQEAILGSNMTALKSALFGIALGLVKCIDLRTQPTSRLRLVAPVYIPSPPPFTWSGAYSRRYCRLCKWLSQF